MFLFDTDILSNLIKRQPSARLVRRLAETAVELQCTSAITVGELVYGAYRTKRPDYFLEKLDRHVWPNVLILSFDEVAARRYGRLRAEMEQAGRLIGEPDLRIAAIALVNKATLVTGNIPHFASVPDLTVENWL